MAKPKREVPASVKKVMRAATRGETLDPQLADLASHFFHQAGGPRAVAQLLYKEYLRAREGSVVRQRILEMVLRCVRFANEQNPRRANLEDLDDADLDRELERLVGELESAAEEKPEEVGSEDSEDGDG